MKYICNNVKTNQLTLLILPHYFALFAALTQALKITMIMSRKLVVVVSKKLVV